MWDYHPNNGKSKENDKGKSHGDWDCTEVLGRTSTIMGQLRVEGLGL